MKLGVISMVRNEADVIHAFLDHLSALFDVAYLLDHRSVDGSGQLMQSAAARHSGWKYLRLEFSGYHQKEVSNLLMKTAFDQAAVDCLFFLDADEFLPVSSRDELEKSLSEVPPSAIGVRSWRNCCPAKLTYDRLRFGSEVWEAPEVSQFGKVVVPRETYMSLGGHLRVTQGNHSVEFTGPVQAPLVPAGDLLHLPIRSLNQLAQKVVVGGLSYRAKSHGVSGDGFHWFDLLGQVAEGKIDQAALIRFSANYGQPLGDAGPRSFEDLQQLGFQCRPFEVAHVDAGIDDAGAADCDGLQIIADVVRKWDTRDPGIAKLVLDGGEIRLAGPIARLTPLVKAGTDGASAALQASADVLPLPTVSAVVATAAETDRAASAEFDAVTETRNFISPALWLPVEEERLPSAWSAHIPLMHCIMRYMRPRRFVELGCHYGTSFFAACRTVRECRMSTECIAVDSWQGDEHAGKYAEDVFRTFTNHLERSYSDFAFFIRGTFAEAVENFDAGAIDLLHIDGYHSYDAVKDDFESWLPKMSEAGVVMLHDTCVRSGTFGVFRLIDELSRKYPCINLSHDHGLGVVAVGSSNSPILRLIKAWAADEKLAGLVVEIFRCFGLLSSRCAELETRTKVLESMVGDRVHSIAEIRSSTSWRVTALLRAVSDVARRVA